MDAGGIWFAPYRKFTACFRLSFDMINHFQHIFINIKRIFV